MFKLFGRKTSISFGIFFLVLLFTFNVKAESLEENTIPLEKATVQAQTYFNYVTKNTKSNWNGGELKFDRVLYDYKGKITAYLFIIHKEQVESGFLITSGNKNISGILESAREGNNPYHGVAKENSIYLGPLTHYKKTANNREFVDIHTNQIVEESKLVASNIFENPKIINDFKKNNEKKDKNSRALSGQMPQYTKKYIQGVPDLTWTYGCTPTAVANIVGYWVKSYPRLDGYNGNTVVNGINSGPYDKVLANLAKFMETTPEGATYATKGIEGLKKYFNTIGQYSVNIEQHSTWNKDPHHTFFDIYKEEINADRPVWLNTSKHPIFNEHSLSGVGYEEFFDPTEQQWYRSAIVHDTWDSTIKDYYLIWAPQIDEVISIKPGTDLNSENSKIYTEKGTAIHYNWGAGAPAGQPKDKFQAKFDQSQFLKSGDYFMQTLADDGVRVTFDNNKIIDRWTDSGGQIDRALLTNVKYGNHSLTTDFYENSGNAAIYSDIVPFDSWLAYYYPNKNLEGLPIDAKVLPPMGVNGILLENNGVGAPTAKVPADGFSARYTTVKRLPAGEYVIRGRADDGIRVLIDGKVVLDRWTASAFREDARVIKIEDGTASWAFGNSNEKNIHLIEVQYLEESNVSHVEFDIQEFWDSYYFEPKDGWLAAFYNNKDLQGPGIVKGGRTSLNKIDKLQFNWGSESPDPGIQKDNFSALFMKVEDFEPGMYEFEVKADDGVIVTVNNFNKIIDSWVPSAGEVRKKQVYLSGKTRISVKYLELEGDANIQLNYKKID
ncbi:PA14 domain-containing protein [Bacillus bombysepticus]|nr:PA14 domain-containing protein [Bacillus thuringiensis]MEC2870080.1 PA14 domain-containing protein [Bacillus cereus]